MKSIPMIPKRQALGILLALILLPVCAMAAGSGTVDTKSLILRESSSKEAKALQTLSDGDSLKIISVSGDWYKVSAGGYTGYVMKKYVSTKDKIPEAKNNDTEKSTKAVSKPSGGAPATCRPGDKGSDVKKLQQALEAQGLYSGKVDGVFGEGTEKAVKAFQKKHGLSQDGIAGQVTIKLLFGEEAADSNSKKFKTEKLDWFNGGESVIPKGASFTVKDVRTGKTFEAKRWSGYNHLDAEPAEKDDTKTMKDIFGGSWSWKRRAILVKYDGHVYAASMNGMPHGTSTLDNGFDGHFCIHFYKSKTHESNKVDAEHQNMVAAAMKAEW